MDQNKITSKQKKSPSEIEKVSQKSSSISSNHHPSLPPAPIKWLGVSSHGRSASLAHQDLAGELHSSDAALQLSGRWWRLLVVGHNSSWSNLFFVVKNRKTNCMKNKRVKKHHPNLPDRFLHSFLNQFTHCIPMFMPKHPCFMICSQQIDVGRSWKNRG